MGTPFLYQSDYQDNFIIILFKKIKKQTVKLSG